MPNEAAVSSVAPFRNPLFLSYWLTGLAANFGWLIQVVGASWLMTSIGGSAEMVAMVQTSLALPTMLFALAAGAMADSFGRRTMVLWSQSFLLIVSTALALVTWFGYVTPWVLLTFTFLIGSGKAFNNPAWQTLVREFMPNEEMPAAIALTSVGFNIARSVGPAIGGVIVASIGAFAAFVVNAVSNVGVILVFLRWKGEPTLRDLPPEPVGSAMLGGLRYVAMSPHILLVVLRGMVFNIGAISFMSLMPVIARDLIHGGPETYGLLLGAFGCGAILGAFFGVRLRQEISLENVARAGFAAFAVSLVVIAASPWMVLTLAVSAVAGASWQLTLSTFNTSVQLSSPRWVVSRCHAIYQSASFAGNALGSWVWGQLAVIYSIQISLYCSAVLLAFGVLMGLVFALRELDSYGLDPHSRWRAPDAKLDLLPRSGPVLTIIEYEIDEAEETAFLAAMAERRRSRLRDGAKRWHLSRDVEAPRFWTEHYQTSTWVDTQRYHRRRTKADADITDRIRALHRGEGPPKVRHHLIRQTGWSSAMTAHADEPSFDH